MKMDLIIVLRIAMNVLWSNHQIGNIDIKFKVCKMFRKVLK